MFDRISIYLPKSNYPYGLKKKQVGKICIQSDDRGGKIDFNPNSYFDSTNYNPVDYDEFTEVVDDVIKRVQAQNIDIDEGNIELCSIELYRDIIADFCFEKYIPLFLFFKMARTKHKKIKNSYYWINGEREFYIYDKKAQLCKYCLNESNVPDNLIRFEMRFKNKDSIKRHLGINNLNEVLNKERYNSLGLVFQEQLEKAVLRFGKPAPRKLISFSRELDALKGYIQNYGGFKDYVVSHGLRNLIDHYGSLDNFKQVLLSIGINKGTVYKNVRKLQLILNDVSEFPAEHVHCSLIRNYREIKRKLFAPYTVERREVA